MIMTAANKFNKEFILWVIKILKKICFQIILMWKPERPFISEFQIGSEDRSCDFRFQKGKSST